MKTFKNRLFKKRNYDCTNLVACVSESAPSSDYIECGDEALEGLTQLYIEHAEGLRVRYYGYL